MRNHKGLTFRYMKSQKKRTILTLIGIILSVALLCAAGIMGESLQTKMQENIKETYGNYHVDYSGVTETQMEKLQNNIKVNSVGVKLNAGIVQINRAQKLTITGANKNFLDMVYYKVASGRLPEKKNEIALEQWVLDNMKGSPKVGDTITLDYTVYNHHFSSSDNPGLTRKMERRFRLTGIFKNTTWSQFTGQPLGVVSIETAKDILQQKNVRMDTAVRFNDNLPLQSVIGETASVLGINSNQIHQNTAMLTISNQSSDAGRNQAVTAVQWILILVIVIATIAVIYNTFHISVIERIHQFGVLRSIGTTPKQLRGIVLGEALILSLIGIPLGLVCGVLGINAVIDIFSISSTATLLGGMKIVVSQGIIGFTALLGFVTILASAFGPAIQAGRISPMEAILNNSMHKTGIAKRKKRPVLAKLIHIEGIMAYENIRRNKTRLFITIFSMSIAIVLFIFFTSFMNLMDSQINGSFHKDFAISLPFSTNNLGYTQTDYKNITQMAGVKAVYRVMQKDESALFLKNQVTQEYKKSLKSNIGNTLKNYDGIQYYNSFSNLYGYRPLELALCKSNLIEGNIDPSVMNKENGVLVSQKIQINGGNVINASQLKVGDEISIISNTRSSEIKPVKLKVVGILDKMPMVYTGGPEQYGIITTEKVFEKLTGINTFVRFDVELTPKANKEVVYQKLKTISTRAKGGGILDFNSSSQNGLQLQLSIILYGIVSVVSIIGALNIINTISTNLILRKREFGILRAVGMTSRQLKKMIALEGIFYGTIASLYGSLIGLIFSRILYIYLNKVHEVTWHLPWQSMLMASAATVVIGLIASIIPLKRVERINIMEAIKNDE